MELFYWEDELSVGNDLIDSEHHKIIDLINEVYTLSLEKKESNDIGSILLELKSYTVYHFQQEEKIFQVSMPLFYEEQKKAHGQMRETLNAFVTSYRNGDKVDLVQFLGFLLEWLISHIQGMDKKHFQYVNGRGNNK